MDMRYGCGCGEIPPKTVADVVLRNVTVVIHYTHTTYILAYCAALHFIFEAR